MEKIIRKMKSIGIQFTKGLTDEEIIKIEEIYNIRFPKILKDFYKIAMPIGNGFYNWLDFSENNIDYIKESINKPINDIIEEIKNSNYWIDNFGTLTDIDERIKRFRSIMENEPKLIPIYSHRYIISQNNVDNPAVLSVMGTDIIVYGDNFEEYINHEFFNIEPTSSEYPKCIGKWIDIMEN